MVNPPPATRLGCLGWLAIAAVLAREQAARWRASAGAADAADLVARHAAVAPTVLGPWWLVDADARDAYQSPIADLEVQLVAIWARLDALITRLNVAGAR